MAHLLIKEGKDFPTIRASGFICSQRCSTPTSIAMTTKGATIRATVLTTLPDEREQTSLNFISLMLARKYTQFKHPSDYED